MKTILQINKLRLLLLFLLPLWGLGGWSQDYQWQWAKNGGGNLPIYNETSGALNGFRAELIWDIVVDEENNYYFLGKIAHGNSHVDGNEVTTFGTATAGNNIIITSFSCNGTYRWSRIIGGGGITSGERAHKLVLDNNGGIYVSVRVANTTGVDSWGNPLSPTCFSEDNCLPYLTGNNQEEQEGFKRSFLLKYNTDNGNLIWRKDYQGDVNYYNNGGIIFHLQIENNNNVLHTIIGLQEGVHLDGALTVELEEGEDFKYYLVKFNSTTGNLIGTPLLLPLEGQPIDNNTSFRYDENLNRYYLAGWGFGGSFTVSFNGVTFGQVGPLNNNFAYLLSFNPDNLQDWWYKEFPGFSGSEINGIAIDNSNSDIYIGGKYFLTSASEGPATFGDYTFSSPVSGNRPYILKMNSQGEVQWTKMPSGYIDPVAETGNYWAYDVAINGNEVVLATHGRSTIWDNFSIDRPAGHNTDPTLIRFNKQTGEVIGLHDIYGSSGHHYLTAVTADKDGNYVVGGAMRYSLFTDNPNDIPTLYNTGSGGAYTDFFMARLAATECGTNVVSNEAFHQPQIKLYPNPTRGVVYIEALQELQSYEVYNLIGQRLLQGGFNGYNVINMQELNQGTYIVKVKTQSGEVLTSKVIKSP